MNLSKKNRAVMILFATLAIGFLFGAGTVAWFSEPEASSGHKHQTMPELPDKEHVERVLAKYEKMLELSPEQMNQIRQELDRCAKAFNNLNDELRPRYEAIGKERRNSIEKLLNDEQLTLYRAHREERRKKSAESEEK